MHYFWSVLKIKSGVAIRKTPMWVQLAAGQKINVVICISDLIPIDHNITIITIADAVMQQLSLQGPSVYCSINKPDCCLSQVTLLLPL